MDCRALAFRRLPHQSKLFLSYLDDFSDVAPFYAHPPKLSAVTRVARKLHFPRERREEVAAILREQNAALGASAATQKNVERLEKGGVAIVTGQQVGLFSGPAYAVYKALTAVRIAQELTRGGVRAVPVFWLATEDHDLGEVRYSTWFHEGKLVRFELPAGAEAGRPVGRIPLGAQMEALVREAAGLLAGPDGETLARILRESYRAEETYGSAFGKLFAKLFAEQGLILLDPLDARLHKIAAPVYRQALAERDTLNEKLLLRGKELDRAGFAAQVKVTARSTLVFHLQDDSRQVITASGGRFHCGERSWTREELLQLAEAEPQHLSPNALLRPVVQDYLLPTAAYIGGPGEIAYFAQSEVIYRQLLGRMPVVLPRADFTLVDMKAAKLLSRYRMSVADIWTGAQEVRWRMEAGSVPKTLARDFDHTVKQFERMLAKLEKPVGKLDPTLHGAVETARKKIGYQLEKLRRKAGKAQDNKAGRIAGHEGFLAGQLYPHKTLQSRELCLLPFLARWGMEGLCELQKLAGSKNLGQHVILSLP